MPTPPGETVPLSTAGRVAWGRRGGYERGTCPRAKGWCTAGTSCLGAPEGRHREARRGTSADSLGRPTAAGRNRPRPRRKVSLRPKQGATAEANNFSSNALPSARLPLARMRLRQPLARRTKRRASWTSCARLPSPPHSSVHGACLVLRGARPRSPRGSGRRRRAGVRAPPRCPGASRPPDEETPRRTEPRAWWRDREPPSSPVPSDELRERRDGLTCGNQSSERRDRKSEEKCGTGRMDGLTAASRNCFGIHNHGLGVKQEVDGSTKKLETLYCKSSILFLLSESIWGALSLPVLVLDSA